MNATNWRDRKIEYLERLYGRWYEKYSGVNTFDDRRLYCNIYRMILEALKTLPEEPINYVCVAMNKAVEEDVNTLQNIVRNFEEKVPEWFDI
jgi:hypothetical protein